MIEGNPDERVTVAPWLSGGGTAPPPTPRNDDDEPAAARPGRRTRIVALTAAALALVAGVAGFGVVLAGGTDAEPASAPVAAPPPCPSVEEPGHVRGDGPGGLDTAAHAVLAFEYGYYVRRSADTAFAAVDPATRMTREALRRDGIDRLPEGTAHCVDVQGSGPLRVTLQQSPPGAEPVVMHQTVEVRRAADGTWRILSITPAETLTPGQAQPGG